MSIEYKSFYRGDQSIPSYYEGTFSKDKIAVPVNSINHLQKSDLITFKIKNKKPIKLLTALGYLFQITRLHWLSLVVMPFVAEYLLLKENGVQFPYFYLSLTSLVLLHFSLFLFNDYFDHIKGLGSQVMKSNIRVLQQGWVSAYTVKRWAALLLFLSLALSIPFFMSYPFFGGLLLLGVTVLLFSYSVIKIRLKHNFSGLIILVCCGPLITISLAIMFKKLYLESTVLGLLFGHMALLVAFSRHFENLIVDARRGIKTFIVGLGFDRSKWLFIFHGFYQMVFFGLWMFYFRGLTDIELMIYISLFAVTYAVLVVRTLAVKTSLSSKLKNYSRLFVFIHTSMSLLIIINFLLK